jgi:cyanophycin synthetase
VEIGQTLGNAFERVLLYEDRGHSGRADGELNALLRRGLSAGRRVAEVAEVAGELVAVGQALDEARPGELVVLGIESIDAALALVQSRLPAAPAHEPTGNTDGLPGRAAGA